MHHSDLAPLKKSLGAQNCTQVGGLFSKNIHKTNMHITNNPLSRDEENKEATKKWVKNATLVIPHHNDETRGISVNSNEEYTVHLSRAPNFMGQTDKDRYDLSESILS